MGFTEDRAYWVARLGWGSDDTNYSLPELEAAYMSGQGVLNPASKPNVTGAKGSNAALASLLTGLVAKGLIKDSSTA